MRKSLGFLLLIAFLSSCGSRIQEYVEETYPDGSPKTVKFYRVADTERELLKEIAYYPNGNKRLEGEFKDGVRHGQWYYWYENGNMWSEGRYFEGKRHGPGITYHENGSKYIEGAYEMGSRAGVWKFWNDQGNLLKEIDYSE